ncbi:MAG: LacI family DNA-binding transcriptional regulator [Opitutaceae bacterium]
MQTRVTLQDIATACGLGKSTVARVLSGNPHVSPAALELVKAKSRELGYRPDPALRILSQHRWNRHSATKLTLALVTLKRERQDSAYAYRSSLVSAADRLGYKLEEFPLFNYASPAKLGTVLFNRGIRGLIIPPIVQQVEWNIDWSRFSVVGCGIGEFRLPIHGIDINHFSAVRLCWQQCLARGYRRIGAALYRQPGPDQNDSLRHAAILYEQSRLPARAPRLPIFDGAFNDTAKFNRWFRRNRPDVVIALNAAAYWKIKDLGKSIPRDVGYCIVSHSGNVIEKLAGATTQHTRIAELAVNWLDQLIRTNESGLPAVPEEILIEPQWIENPSLRPAPGPA